MLRQSQGRSLAALVKEPKAASGLGLIQVSPVVQISHLFPPSNSKIVANSPVLCGQQSSLKLLWSSIW